MNTRGLDLESDGLDNSNGLNTTATASTTATVSMDDSDSLNYNLTSCSNGTTERNRSWEDNDVADLMI